MQLMWFCMWNDNGWCQFWCVIESIISKLGWRFHFLSLCHIEFEVHVTLPATPSRHMSRYLFYSYVKYSEVLKRRFECSEIIRIYSWTCYNNSSSIGISLWSLIVFDIIKLRENSHQHLPNLTRNRYRSNVEDSAMCPWYRKTNFFHDLFFVCVINNHPSSSILLWKVVVMNAWGRIWNWNKLLLRYYRLISTPSLTKASDD